MAFSVENYYRYNTRVWVTTGDSESSGSVMSVSAGDLSPIFTTAVVSATSNPIISFHLSDAPANSILAGPESGVDAPPSYRSLIEDDIPSLDWSKILNAPDLAALEDLTSTGLAVRTDSDVWALRSIYGTSNRITISDGDGVSGNPTIDIASGYEGQSSITTLGTISTGTWQGTAIETVYAGTPTGGSTGQVLTKNSNTNYDYSWQDIASGSVSSVGLALPSSLFSVTGSPVTGSGTLTGSLINQSAFTGFFARTPQAYNDSEEPVFRAMNNSDLPIRNGYKVRLTGIPFAFGDSFTVGAPGPTPGTFAWLEQFKAANGGITINNQAVVARGINTAVLAAYAQMPTFMNGNTVLMMVGFNDGGRNGAASGTLNKINNGHRAIMANAWLRFAIAASAATNTGTWSNFTTIIGKASNLGGNTRQSSTAGDTISYTTTEASDNIVVFCYGTDGVTYDHGRFTVTIDGTVMTTYNPNGQTDGVTDGAADNGRVPNALVFNGLRNSTHTVTITLLDSKTTLVDAIGYMTKPEECAGIIVSSIPRRNAAGYASGSATDSTVTTTNASLESDLETNFQFRPWVLARQERRWNTATDIYTDDIHPNNVGSLHLFQTMQDCVWERSAIASTIRFTPHTTIGPSAWLSNAGNGMSIFHNTNTATNAVINASAGSIILQSNVTAGAGNTALNFFASASGGGNPALRWKIDNTGRQTWSNTTDGTFLDLSGGSVGHFASGNMILLAGASVSSASAYTAKLTAASVANLSPTSGLVLFTNASGLTIGNTFTPTEIGRIGPALVRFSANMLVGNNSGTPAGTIHIAQAALSGANIIPGFRVDTGAHTSATATTEFHSIFLNIASSTIWAAGTVAEQRFVRVAGPTSGTGTMTRSVTFSIDGPPSAGTGTASIAIGLEVKSRSLSNTTTGIGAVFSAPTSATTNIASAFIGSTIFGSTTITSGSVLADFQSTTLGVLMPRVTNVASVTTPVAGMIVYDSASNKFNFRENTSWVTISASGVGGSTGATDRRILIANGTGGATLQNSLIGIDSSGNIIDVNANELIKFTATASAVNEFTLANATTTNPPTLSVTGGDTNIGMRVETKGNGGFAVATNGSVWTFVGSSLSTAGNADYLANLAGTFGGGTSATLFTSAQLTANSGDINIATGSVAGGTGNSGDIIVAPGTSAGGTRGIVRLKGSNRNDSANAGDVGEEYNAIQSTYTNYTTTATYQNVVSITLTPGDWDLSAFFTYSVNSSTMTGNSIFVISTTTASASGATEGRNIAYIGLPTLSVIATFVESGAIPSYRVSISSNTTYYLNTQASFSAGNPQFVGGIRARRVR